MPVRSIFARLAIVLARSVLFAQILLVLTAPDAHALESIQRFESDITIETSGTLAVTETLGVMSDGMQIRHGIYRDFPLTTPGGGGMSVGEFEAVSAALDGQPAEMRVTEEDDHIRVYIGSEDVVVRPGFHVFELQYRIDRQIRFFRYYDELFWNVTGTQWTFPIERAFATVHLPPGAEAKKTTLYTGAYGSRDQAGRSEIGKDGTTVRFATTAPLASHEGLTIAVAFTEGVVSEPGVGLKLSWVLRDHRAELVALLGFSGLLMFFWLVWRFIGPERPGLPVVKRKAPPPGISPTLAHYIAHDGTMKDSAFIAASMDLGIRGYLTIIQSGSDWTLERTPKIADDPALPAEEAAILSSLESAGGAITVEKTNRKEVLGLLSSFRHAMEREHGGTYYKPHHGWIAAGAILAYALMFAIAYLTGVEDPIPAWWFPCLPLPFAAVCIIVMIVRKQPNLMAQIAATLGVSLGASALFWLMFIFIEGSLTFVAAMVFIGSVVALGLFAAKVGRTTALGRARKSEIEGFRLFIENAGAKSLFNRLDPQTARKRFETLLPFAVALDVELPWSQGYAAALRRASRSSSSSALIWSPVWYHGMSFSPDSIGLDLSSACQSMTSGLSACSASSTSGSASGFSAGGGFSGGGGGGGGGGGW